MSETEMWGSGDGSMPCKREDLSLSPQDPRESLAQQHTSVPRMRIRRQEPPEAGGQLGCVARDENGPISNSVKGKN